MNPYTRFKNWIIGDALASTDDMFEQVRIDVLFSFTVFFFLSNLPYTFLTFSLSTFHFCLGLFSSLALLSVIVVMRLAKSIKPATILYVSVHCFLNLFHFVVNNGKIEGQGTLFMVLIIFFSFLMLDRMWGWIFTFFVIVLIITGGYNTSHDFSLFNIPQKYHDPGSAEVLAYLILIPLLVNAYLVSKFVYTKQKAEIKIKEQSKQLEVSNKNLESKNEDIVSSILYAKRIQQAVLPPEERIQRDIPLSFIIYRPKDIVSGDFFWFHSIDSNRYILAVADCTGHGVPGAFMTVIGSNLMNQIIIENKNYSPAKILSELDNRLTAQLRQEKQHRGLVQDGMDISIIAVDKTKKQVNFSSAKRPAILIRDGKLEEFKGSKMSIGGLRTEQKEFKEILIDVEEDDCLYLYSDGIVDQFGGSQNKKFTSKRLREKLMEISGFPVHEQQREIEEMISGWKGTNEQTDDVLIAGIRF